MLIVDRIIKRFAIDASKHKALAATVHTTAEREYHRGAGSALEWAALHLREVAELDTDLGQLYAGEEGDDE